jgi:hypothetical protein
MAIYLKAWGIINFWQIIRFIQSATIACCLRFLSMKEMFAVHSIIMITYANMLAIKNTVQLFAT